MKTLNNRIQKHLKENPSITEKNYCNINPYFGRYDDKGILKDEIYIGSEYIINIYGDVLFYENTESGKTTKRKIN